jgi:hypothetical protein
MDYSYTTGVSLHDLPNVCRVLAPADEPNREWTDLASADEFAKLHVAPDDFVSHGDACGGIEGIDWKIEHSCLAADYAMHEEWLLVSWFWWDRKCTSKDLAKCFLGYTGIFRV